MMDYFYLIPIAIGIGLNSGSLMIGTIGEKAATVVADFIVVDMFANYCTGREDLKGAIAQAERQAKRIYR